MSRLTAVLALLIILLATVVHAAPNIYPDPSFENTGEIGMARTGTQAMHLAVGARNHWDARGGALPVEPFARYRVTEWVKGTVGQGNFIGPFAYEWNSYEWAFSAGPALKTSKDWVQSELTFISPLNQIQLHPLAYIDASDCDMWADDIVVEKITEPAQAMAELEAQPNRSASDNEILARWYVSQGQPDRAEAIMNASGDSLMRADIACVLAKATADADKRHPYIVEMLVSGAPGYHDGLKRFDEVTAGLSDDQKLQICEEALKTKPEPSVAKSYSRVVDGYITAISGSLRMADASAKLASLTASAQRLRDAIPANSPAAKEMQAPMNSIAEAEKAFEARKAQLGHCKIVIGGKTLSRDTHVIVIPENATLQEKHAAEDLAYHLELVCGEAPQIQSEKEAGFLDRNATPKLIPLVVGKCRLVRKLDKNVNFKSLGTEGIYIRTVGPALILAGNQRGVLYATYSFLEDNIGCRWFTPECATWPQTGTISVPELNRRYIPPLEYRGTDYPCSLPGDYSVRNRYNGGNHRADAERGGHVGVHSLAHTFNYLVPPDKYFATHPEYYSEINGKRFGPENTQLCLTNPDVLRIATESIRRWIKENPDKTIFSVSQNDYWNYCTCPKCTAVAQEEGSQSGGVVRFINQIADAIKDEYPNVAIETLAYQYTRKPPLHVQPRPNVIICLCSIECCFIHPLGSDPFNKTFVDDIKGWNKICNRLYIWDYVINYAHSICPFPNLYVLKPNTQFFIKNGVKGIYEEACYFTKGSEMQELRSYIMAKTLWDPNYSTDKAIDEFCAGFYGPAGKYVREYINLIQKETQQNPKLHVAIYTHPKAYVTQNMIAKSKAIFDEAEAAVKDNPTYLHRVQVARLPIMYAEITLASSGSFAQQNDRLVQAAGDDVTAVGNRFEKIARAKGVTMLREGGADAELDAWLQSIPRRSRDIKIEQLQNSKLQVSVIPELGGRIWRMKTAEGRDLMMMNGKEGSWMPSDGGYEEFSEGGYRTPGWGEPYTVKERTGRAVTVEANLRNGLRLTRHFELDADKALLKVTSTLTNVSGETKPACLRAHPEFAVSTTAKTKVRVLQADGSWKVYDLARPKDPKMEDNVWLQGDSVPAGAWTIVDEGAGLTLTNRVPRAQIGQCLLNWNGGASRVNLEVYSPEMKLAPGQSITLDQSYEVAKAETK